MNKKDFLAKLAKQLEVLSAEEREDILRDMEEFFHEGMKRGRSEEEIVEQLGSPESFSETIVAETKVKRIRTAPTVSQKLSALFAALLAILLLTPFNLFFILIPLIIITFIIIIGWVGVGVIAVAFPIICLLVLIMAFHVGFKLFALFALLFFVVGWFGLAMAAIVGIIYLTVFYFKVIARLFMWNINFIKNRMKG